MIISFNHLNDKKNVKHMVFTRGLNLHIFLLWQLLIIIEDFPNAFPHMKTIVPCVKKMKVFFSCNPFFSRLFF